MSIAKSPMLGVLGGLGPMASAYFYRLVTAHTVAGKDQDHIDIVLSSRATTPDRTAFILGQSDDDPFTVMEEEAGRLVTYGASVIAVPCNTAHYFYERLNRALPVPVPVLNMVDATVKKAKALGCRRLGILATDGTVHTDTYQRVCKAEGLACEIPSPNAQKGLMRLIYDDIKRGRPPEMQLFNAAADELRQAGCSCIVLGCTELSLVKEAGLLGPGYLDSMDVLAEEAILACGKQAQGFAWEGAVL